MFRSHSGLTNIGAAILAATLLAAACGLAGPSSAAPVQAEAQPYGVGITKNADIAMDDGVHLSADIFYPTDPATGAKAAGSFPVLLIQTPYGKSGPASARTANYFVAHGYMLVVADIRGFGASHGQAAWFGHRAGQDGAALADWSAHLDGANGKVGLMGCSWLGMTQYFTANALPADSPVKAMAPFCVDSNFYRDLTVAGGIPTQIMTEVRGLAAPGVDDDPATDPYMQLIVAHATGDDAFYNANWERLNTTRMLPKVVKSGIPVLNQGGWYDIYPGGNIDAYLAAQNAFGGRAIDRPLKSGDAVSGRYQAIVGPWVHGEHMNDSLQPIMLQWFDTWLKAQPTRMADTASPLHLFVIGEDRWIDSATWPLTDKATSYHLSAGTLSTDAPKACQGCTQTLLWSPEGEGRNSVTFSSAPLDAPLIIGGPGNVTVSLTSTRPEVELVATLYDVSPDGAARKVTDGALLGSARALDIGASWYSAEGKLIRPAHDFTKEKRSPVPVGQPVRLDIELMPTVIRIPAGHRLKLVLSSQPSPSFHQYGKAVPLPNPLAPTPEQLKNLTGGIYTILTGSGLPLELNLSTASEGDLTPSPVDWGPKD